MKSSRLLRILPTSFLLMSLAGCHDSTPFSYDADRKDDEGEITITLRVPLSGDPVATRAFPTGGENGDGREDGFEYENAVSDVNLFFFEGNGLNAPDATLVTGVYVKKEDMAKFIVDTDELPFEKKIAIKIKTDDTKLEENGILTATNVSFITVLNAGEDLSGCISTLKGVHEYSAFSASKKLDDGAYGSFIMTTAYDAPASGFVSLGSASVNVGSNRLVSDKNAPSGKGWKGETTVQRLCARVDLMYTGSNVGKDELIYSTDAGNKVHITNILPVNFMECPSYLIRKVTANIPEKWDKNSLPTITWGGLELTEAGSDKPSNYVLEPTTLEKADGIKGAEEWYGNSEAATVLKNIAKAQNGKITNYLSGSITKGDNNGCDKIIIIGYPDENIQIPSCYSSDYISGLAFRGIFQPVKIIRQTGDSFSTFDVTDQEWNTWTDKTIWRYQPSITTDGVTDANALYFIREEHAKAYQNAHPSDLATITKYDKGVCYYNIWLRHYNNEDHKNEGADPKSTYPMEFAVVRNNIYRVALSFTGPGDPTPTLREPDTMMSRIFVRKWNKREEKKPLQF